MKAEIGQDIHKILGSNSVLIILADGYNHSTETAKAHYLPELAFLLIDRLKAFGIINNKYKKAIIDLADVRAIKQRKKLTDNFLLQIRNFKNEISGNELTPMVIIMQAAPEELSAKNTVTIGYGQGERNHQDRPHRPTIAPSLLSKIRVALEDQGLHTQLAATDSDCCGNQSYTLNQLFKQKNYLEGFYDPEVCSFLVYLSPDLFNTAKKSTSTAQQLDLALSPFCQPMSLVRKIDSTNVDAQTEEDLQYIFRIHKGDHARDLLRESYIEDLAGSIDRNGLLHPLVLLQKKDGRYKILCGFRRFQALKRLGRQWIEAKVFDESAFTTEEFFNISLAENTKRRNLNPLEIGNFLESASNEMGLNNARLAEEFGETLGIGTPGRQVNQSTISRYRKINRIRVRGESPEIISDVINEKLQFSIAAEILAPIKDPGDRDSLYLEIIKPLRPTRPQLIQIQNLLSVLASSLKKAINTRVVQQALTKTVDADQPAATFIRHLQKKADPAKARRKQQLDTAIQSLRTSYFGKKASKRDFNITPSSRRGNREYTIHVRVKDGKEQDVLKILQQILSDNEIQARLSDQTE